MISFKNVLAVLFLLAINVASQDQIDIIKSKVENWNKWREENPSVRPNLEGAHLEGADLRQAHLEGAYLAGAHLWETNLDSSHLEGADLDSADLRGADLRGVNLDSVNLWRIYLKAAGFRGAR